MKRELEIQERITTLKFHIDRLEKKYGNSDAAIHHSIINEKKQELKILKWILNK